jgi:hypothetical protein
MSTDSYENAKEKEQLAEVTSCLDTDTEQEDTQKRR